MSARYLVTGGAGFIGAHLARRLLERGDEVVVVDDLSTGSAPPPGAELVVGDVADDDTLRRLPSGIDAVFHLAAQSSGEASFDDPVADARTNILGTVGCLRWAARRSVRRFVYASSMAVYGQPGPAGNVAAVDEDAPCRPLSFYGTAKLACEHYARLFEPAGLSWTALRMFSVYGPGQDMANLRQGMVSIYLAKALAGEPILVKGSLDRVRDVVYVDDVVDAWLAAAGDERAAGRVYNVGAGRPVRVGDLVREVVAACGHDPDDYPVVQAPPTPGDQFGLFADTSRIHGDLQWTAKVPLRDGLARMVAACRPAAP